MSGFHARPLLWAALLGGTLATALGCSVPVTSQSQSASKTSEQPAVETCATLEACIARLRDIARSRKGESFGGMGRAEGEVAERLRTMPGVVDAVMPLLADPEIGVAHMASYVLSDVDTIDARYLPQIKAGLDRDLGWLAPALARIGTDEAAREAVARFLVSDSAPGNQEAFALALFGTRAIPFIVAAARCEGGCKTGDDHRNLGHVLGELNAAGAQAVPGLLEVIDDPSTSDDIDRGALGMIGDVGEHARPWQDAIAALAKNRPALVHAIDRVLVEIHSDRAGEIMSQRLRDEPSVFELREIAALGKYGRSAVPAVLELLHDEDPGLRLGAVRALGAIGDVSVAPALSTALQDPADVRVNRAAAIALGSIRANGQTTALERAAKDHWHPAVRSAANDALRTLREPSSSDREDGMRPAGFFDDFGSAALDCDKPAAAIADEPKKLLGNRDSKRLSTLEYTTSIVSYGPPEDAKPNKSGVIAMTTDTMIRHERTTLQTPNAALRVDGGWLAGSDRGEWGGELVWLGDDGLRQTIRDGNITNLHRFGDRIVAVSGLAHMMSNEGNLLTVERMASGSWRASVWRTLPGAPIASWLTPERELLVNTLRGGPLLIDTQGRMRIAPCTGKP
jgi:HEAT repeats